MGMRNASNKDQTMSEDEPIAERIVDKRVVNGETSYLVKWRGYSQGQNTWEPLKYLNCPELIKEFEDVLREGENNDSVWSAVSNDTQVSNRSSGNNNSRSSRESTDNIGFNFGHEVEAILGVSELNGPRLFLIKWKGIEKTTLVDSKVCNVKIPQIVIKFYESHISSRK